MNMEIKPLIGLSDILLGMSRDSIKNLLGEPKSTRYFSPLSDNDKAEIWLYSNGIELYFSADENYLLSTIIVESNVSKLDNFDWIGVSEKELKLKFPQIEAIDNFEDFGKDYILPNKEISFWVVEGRVRNLTISSKVV
jgi:hypothetical protein